MKISVPVISNHDVLIIGGTIHAIKTALDLKAAGHSVFIATPYSFFGEGCRDFSRTVSDYTQKRRLMTSQCYRSDN